MPFTLSHPAIVLPGYRLRYLDFTALIIGSIAPDMEYFFRRQAMGMLGHSPLGLLVFDLPLTIIVALLFHQIIKPALIAHLPSPYDRAYPAIQYQPWITTSASYWKIPLSAILGAASHILWDSLTHRSGFLVKQLPSLHTTINIVNLNLPTYTILQYGFSLLGLGVILVAIYRTFILPLDLATQSNAPSETSLANSSASSPTVISSESNGPSELKLTVNNFAPHNLAANKWRYWIVVACLTVLSASLRSSVIAAATGLQWVNEFLVGALSGLFAGLLIMGRWYLRHNKQVRP